jgi:2-keto-4-pentenoate hydratase
MSDAPRLADYLEFPSVGVVRQSHGAIALRAILDGDVHALGQRLQRGKVVALAAMRVTFDAEPGEQGDVDVTTFENACVGAALTKMT